MSFPALHKTPVLYAFLTCQLIGCDNYLSLEFDLSALPGGAYNIEVNADEKEYRCKVYFDSQHIKGQCDHADVVPRHLFTRTDNTRHLFFMDLSGITPEKVSVRITQKGHKFYSKSFTPQYEDLSPNGQYCEPHCRVSNMTIKPHD